ncbi:hypothetical protein DB771_18070 [Burkholderia sp. AU29985]|uniref:hypothetical protein n=1 Tax=Burkholderia dolosa TaxID=152500 RepID=UPI0002F8A6BE|nr:hypothetical protein [Burkholderia dolosa]AJY11155.1 hypothetical protein AK34_5160 [Burkholderia dolosa AU0158]AKE01967.1 hypothetical protein XM57_02730 [Burkholderia cepacia]PRE51061.1 hypothetical protein C6P87_11320 [Burkholderia sp. AU12872]PUA75417.1 hypothetical protein DB771_18070 [Burkholderia sp. AU29985]AYZ95607.1 hypothetical protein EGY28_10405 [Burkholderia dolosa]
MHVAEKLTVVLPVDRFRIAVISRHFGEEIQSDDVANKLGIPLLVSQRHTTLIVDYLMELERAAWSSLYHRLADSGLRVSEKERA